ncbi:DUF2147 domain-containing protein [Burkholderiaceae bacterium FT117]|uniref:DUF2147 domain-containing protein n=1 Tax=Zeimonas sediminis TaxID=2944268 RepID=UPI002342D1A9|nr:DUF2147 domain-containing protein [Zeimonas sediminis]MCM5570825.1 DUF2147 domain-containing protein [Zeimonas sediminis]
MDSKRNTARGRGPAAALLAAAALVAATAGAPAAFAQPAASPAGLWKNIDDETKQPKALVRIVEAGGGYSGRIEKILTDKPDAVCDLCTDERKGKPVQGMTIIDGMQASKVEDGLYEGGRILDPGNGKVYRSQMRLLDGGRSLEVRGYVGLPLFGRSQTWIREQ